MQRGRLCSPTGEQKPSPALLCGLPGSFQCCREVRCFSHGEPTQPRSRAWGVLSKTPPWRATPAKPGAAAARGEAGKAGRGTGLSGEEELGQDAGKSYSRTTQHPPAVVGVEGQAEGHRSAWGHWGGRRAQHPPSLRRQAAGWAQVGCCWLLSPSQQTHTLLMFALLRAGHEFLGVAPLPPQTSSSLLSISPSLWAVLQISL